MEYDSFLDLYIRDEIYKLKVRYSIYEIHIKDLLNQPQIKFNAPIVMKPIEKKDLEESSIEIKHNHKSRLVAYISLQRNTKLIFEDCNVILHIIVLFGQFKLNGKRFIAKDHIVLYNNTLLECEFLYIQIITKYCK